MSVGAQEQASRRAPRAALLVSAVASLAGALLVIWLPPVPPCQDAPGHITTARALLEPALFDGLLRTDWAPTAQAFTGATYAFGHLAGVFVAAKLALTSFLALQVWAFRRIAVRVGGSAPLAVVGACAGFVAWPYAMGFFNYLGALALGSAGLALWIDKDRSVPASALAALAFAAAGWAHAIVGGMVLTHAIALDVVARRGRAGVARDAAVLAPSATLIAVTLAAVLGAHDDIGAVEATASVYAGAGETLRNWFATGAVGFSPLGYASGALLFAAALVAGFGARGDTYVDRLPRASAIGALVWSACFFALPLHGLGWHFASPRVLFFVFALPAAFAVLGAPLARAAAGVAAVAAAAALVHAVPLATAEGARLQASLDGYGQQAVGRAYLVTYAPEARHGAAPYAQPNVGTGRYATWHGGVDPGQFAINPMAHSIQFARPMGELFPRTRSLFTVVDAACLADAACASAHVPRADAIAASAVRWDSVVLTEVPPEVSERLIARGFAPSAENVLRPQPAQLNATVTLPSVPPPGPVVFRAGYPETVGFFRGGTIPADRFAELAPTLRFDALPAGPIAVEVFVDNDGDGALGGADTVLMRQGASLAPGQTLAIGAAP